MSDISREETDAKIDAAKAEFRCLHDVALSQYQSEFKQIAADLKSEVHRSITSQVKWVTGAVTAVVAVGVSMMALMLNNALKYQASPAPQQQAPIIVSIPAPILIPGNPQK